MANDFLGRTAKFKRNGHTYYAKFDESSLEKNIYGDKYSSPRGWKAKINVGADGKIFELVENSSYDHSKPEKGKKGAVHKNVGYWDYFVKTVQVDNIVYDVLINIRRKTEQDYVYSIRLWENKKIKASPPVGTSEMSSVNLGAQHFKNNISRSAENVKQKGDFSLFSKDTTPKKYGDYAVYGEDVMLEGEKKPTGKREFTAPTRESIAEGKKKVITGAPMRADVNPLKNEQVEGSEAVEPIEATVIKTVEDRITAKIENSKEELSNNQRLLEESNADFDRRIAEAGAEYDAKKNKNTAPEIRKVKNNS